VYVGAGIEARDRVVGIAGELANRYGSRTAVEKEIKRSRREVESDLKKFERRGNTARNQLERDVRKARTRLERVARRNNVVSEQIAGVSTRVENVAQVGVAAAQRVGTLAKDRIAAIA